MSKAMAGKRLPDHLGVWLTEKAPLSLTCVNSQDHYVFLG
jgi:hypothetical protein